MNTKYNLKSFTIEELKRLIEAADEELAKKEREEEYNALIKDVLDAIEKILKNSNYKDRKIAIKDEIYFANNNIYYMDVTWKGLYNDINKLINNN